MRSSSGGRVAVALVSATLACLAASARAEVYLPGLISSHAGETKPRHNHHLRSRNDDNPVGNIEGDVLKRPPLAPPPPPPPLASPPPAKASSSAAGTTPGGEENQEALGSPPSSTPSPSSSSSPSSSEGTSASDVAGKTTPPPPLVLYTWGIGGARVGRPSDPSPTPPAIAEGFDPTESILGAAASGHSVAVTDAGALYTCGRNDSAGGGGHGSPPVDDAGQLGRGGRADVFERVRLFPPREADANANANAASGIEEDKEKIVQASAGRYHTTALSASGRVYTFGLNDRGQLGRAGVAGDPRATRPCVCDSGGSCGCATTPPAAADAPESTREGARCFGGPTCRDGTARAVDFGAAHAGKRATFTASGRYATAATLDTGEVLAWGLVLCGAGKDALADPAAAAARLLANPLEAATPRSVVAPGGPGGGADGSPDGTNLFLSDRAVAVDIGYVHAVVLTESGRVFSCDTGFDGYAGGLSDAFAPNGQHQLGRVAASPAAALAPGLVEFPFPKIRGAAATEPTSGGAGEDAPRSKDDDDDDDDDEEDENKIVAVAAGRCHGAAVDAGGRAYFFGCGALGGVTAGGRENEGLPRLVDDAILRGRAVVDVAAGEHFTLASAADGGMVGWGDGNSGQLGLDADALDRERRRDGDDGRNANAPGPAGGAVEVPMGEGARVVAPVAGYQHALAIVAKEAPRRRR